MATTYVSGGGATLANAIKAASAGDVLVVADGVYSPWTGNVKNITVVSEHGPANCIIDGGCVWQDGIVGGTLVTQGIRCISCYGGMRTIFRGFTIQNGGIFENDGQANNSQGGGAYGGEFQRCIFKNNYCWKEGGGCTNSNTFRCEFVGNIALVAGAATRSGNHKFDYIHNNGRIGTGTYCGACYVGDYFGCLIIGNISSGQGAGMMLGNSVNCTIAGNHSTVKNGYGVMLNNGTYSSMHNCIVYGNTTTKTDSDKSEFKADSSIAFSVTDSCLPENSVFGSNVENVRNILADPMFVGNGDYRLTALSPCIGRAVATWMNNDEDFSGRYWKSFPSVGCYEYYLQTEPRIPNGINPLGVPKTVLPYDAEVEYLESTGAQWIDTGVVPADKVVEQRLDARFPDITSLVVASESVVNESVDNCRSVTVYNGNFRWKYNMYAMNFATADTLRHTFVANGPNGNWLFDGVDTNFRAEQMVTPSTNTMSIACFASHQPWQDPVCFRLAVYSYVIIVDGVLVRDFIPVRKNGVGYLFDKVSGQMFGNKGTGSFLYGADKGANA